MPEMTFEQWWQEVRVEAERCEVLWLLVDRETHREGYEDGYTPAEEIEEQIYAAQVSQ